MAWSILTEVEQAAPLLSDLQPSDRHVLLWLSYHADKDTRQARPGNKRLSTLTGVSEETVSRSIRRLADLGLIKIIQAQSPRLIEVLDLAVRSTSALPGLDLTSSRVDLTSSRVDLTSSRVDLTSSRVDLTSSRVDLTSNGTSQEPVREPVTEPVNELPPPSASGTRSGMNNKTTRLDQKIEYFMSEVGKINRDLDLKHQVGRYSMSTVRGAFSRVRKKGGLDYDRDFGPLIDQYCANPHLWKVPKGGHPWQDFCREATQGRLLSELERKRQAAELAAAREAEGSPKYSQSVLEMIEKGRQIKERRLREAAERDGSDNG